MATNKQDPTGTPQTRGDLYVEAREEDGKSGYTPDGERIIKTTLDFAEALRPFLKVKDKEKLIFKMAATLRIYSVMASREDIPPLEGVIPGWADCVCEEFDRVSVRYPWPRGEAMRAGDLRRTMCNFDSEGRIVYEPELKQERLEWESETETVTQEKDAVIVWRQPNDLYNWVGEQYKIWKIRNWILIYPCGFSLMREAQLDFIEGVVRAALEKRGYSLTLEMSGRKPDPERRELVRISNERLKAFMEEVRGKGVITPQEAMQILYELRADTRSIKESVRSIV